MLANKGIGSQAKRDRGIPDKPSIFQALENDLSNRIKPDVDNEATFLSQIANLFNETAEAIKKPLGDSTLSELEYLISQLDVDRKAEAVHILSQFVGEALILNSCAIERKGI